MYVVLAVLIYRAQPVLITAYPALTLAAVAVLVAAAVALAATAATRQWTTLPLRMAICAVAALLSLQFGALAGVRPEAVEIAADLVRANRSGNEPVAIYRTLARNLVFYSGLKQIELYNDEQAVTFLGANERVLLVARAQDILRLQSLVKIPIKAIGSVEYIDPAAIRLATLFSPLPRRDITDVMVVTNR
jgi:hypothetical protein